MIAYYSEDVNRRATDDNNSCYYLNKNTGNKCAIGRYIINEDVSHFFGGYKKLIEIYPNCLPKEIKKLGVMFLSHVQFLHDDKEYWNKTGLTPKGIVKLNIIKENIKNKIYIGK